MTPDLKQLFEQAQEMQKNMQLAQQQLAEMNIVGQSKDGRVTINMNGRHEATRTKVDHSLLDEELDILEEAITEAINQCSEQIEKRSQEKILDLTANLNIPPEFQMPSDGE